MMETKIQNILEKLTEHPGQGNIWEQIEKLVRRQQRTMLYKMIETLKEEEIANFPVIIRHTTPQYGKKLPATIRLHLVSWKNEDEVFWQALGDYLILALWSVKDVEFNRKLSTLRIEYFNTLKRRFKSPEFIANLVSRLSFLIENEQLPTDFTRFRRMAERRDTIAGLSLEEAAFYGAAIKFLPSVFGK